MPTLKTGDIVQLKSGGPKMTVMGVSNETVHCQWFAGSKLESGFFRRESLQAPAAPEAQSKK